MTDTPASPKFPLPEVRESLMRLSLANREKVAALNGELGDRLRNMYELYPDMTPKNWRVYDGLMKTAKSNELKAREEIRLLRLACDIAEADIAREGHTGDFDDMARAAAEQPVSSAPAEPEASPEPESAAPPADSVDSFREELHSTIAEGDRHIKAVAETMPDLPKALDRRREKAPAPDKAAHGSFRILS